MMKKLLLTAAFAVLAAGAAMAQQTVFIGEQGYDDLGAACAAAQEGDVINVTADQTISSRVNIGGGDAKIAYTIQGTEGVKITRSAATTMFLLWKNSNVTVKNLTFDGGNFTNLAIENKNNGSTLIVENCEFINFATNNDNPAVIQTNKEAKFTNIDLSTCESPHALFVGNSNTTIAGEIKGNMYIENQFSVTQNGQLTGAIDVYLQNVAAGRVVVKNCTTPDVYTLKGASEGYGMAISGSDLVVNFTKNVAMIEGTEQYYTSVVEAFNAATDGQTVVVLESCDLTGRLLSESRTLTVKGATDGIVLTRTDNNTNNLMIEAKNRTLTVQNLTFNCNNININKPVISVHNNGGSAIVLDNVKLLNGKSSQGLIVAGAGRNVTLNNVTAENTAEGTKGIVMSGNLSLNGNNNIPVELGETGKISVPEDGELTNEEPIMLTVPETAEAGNVVVSGTYAYKKFALTNDGLYLKPNVTDNTIELSNEQYTGIADITVDENAPVEYFNLQGVRVANPENGLYIRRQGGKATKVYVK